MKYPMLAALLWASGCVEPSTQVPLDQDFEIAVGQTVAITGTAQTLTFEAVPEDSRCPIDAICIWAGNARVSLRVTETGKDSSIALNTGSEPRSVTLGSLRLELRALLPAPRAATPTPPDTYRATLRITRP
jgi:hypothetical protein